MPTIKLTFLKKKVKMLPAISTTLVNYGTHSTNLVRQNKLI